MKSWCVDYCPACLRMLRHDATLVCALSSRRPRVPCLTCYSGVDCSRLWCDMTSRLGVGTWITRSDGVLASAFAREQVSKGSNHRTPYYHASALVYASPRRLVPVDLHREPSSPPELFGQEARSSYAVLLARKLKPASSHDQHSSILVIFRTSFSCGMYLIRVP